MDDKREYCSANTAQLGKCFHEYLKDSIILDHLDNCFSCKRQNKVSLSRKVGGWRHKGENRRGNEHGLQH